MTLSEEIKAKLLERGASIVGFADLSVIPEKDRSGFKNGIILGIAVRPEVIRGIGDGPTMEYYNEYNRINKLLNEIGEYTENLLKEKGFGALAKTQKVVVADESTWRTELPHKTVATRAGIGWIGKSALLVTEEFGSAVRITSVLTNAELETGQPIKESKCGTCNACKEVCPAGAVSGELWDVSKDRDQFYNAFDCRKKARERSAKIGLEVTLCRLCILHCPWTQAYLKRL